MYVPNRIFELFHIAKDSMDSMREELAVLKAEKELLKDQLNVSRRNFDWISQRVNSLELERAQLMKVAYNINTPVPEIVRAPKIDPLIQNFNFEDMGEELAAKMGLPTYD